MSNILSDTVQLKELLAKAEETGKIAWRIGETAVRIRDEKTFINFPNKICLS